MTHKECYTCKQTKPLSEYYFLKQKNKYRTKCNTCVSGVRKKWEEKNRELRAAQKRDYYKANKEEMRAKGRQYYQNNSDKSRSYYLYRKYGVTLELFEKMSKEQDGKCAICFLEPGKNQYLCVDHCHTTGNIRKLLCSNCNTGIGLLKEDPEILASAIKYLSQKSAV